MNRIKEIVAKDLYEVLNHSVDLHDLQNAIEIPKKEGQGDLAFPCFMLSKIEKMNPVEIAKRLESTLSSTYYESKAIGGFLNFYIDESYLYSSILPDILKQKDRYGTSDEGRDKCVIVEYSSANISKELHFGYIRGIMIGLSLYKISKELGYNTVAINHLGDYGINFGKIITAYLRWGNEEDVNRRGVSALLDLYVRFNNEQGEDETLMEDAVKWFYKLEEEKDEEAIRLWTWFKKISLDDYMKVYDKLGCHFDSFAGESFYSDKMPQVLEELREKQLLTIEDKTVLINLEDEGLTNAIVTTSAGTSLYITRDIAAALYRKKHYDFYKCFYVVGSEQKLHFKQLKAIIKKMGYDWWDDIVHVDHGLIMLEDGKISSRKGDTIFLENVLAEAEKRTSRIMMEKNTELAKDQDLVRQIAYGAIAFNELSTTRNKDYTFKWEDAISFDGETGPYLQYANVRCQSLLKKGHFEPESVDYSLIQSASAKQVVLELAKYKEKIREAFDKQDPSVLARYLISLSKVFNKYYQQESILVEDVRQKNANLALVQATSTVFENGMRLINMRAPEKM